MNRADVARLLAIVVMAYPNYDKFKDEAHVKTMTNMWADFFKDDDSGLVGLAIKKHISTSKWPPAIAEIREIMADIAMPDIIPPDEAWAAVSQLLYVAGEHCYHDIHSLLPKPIADTVDEIGYSNLYGMHVASVRGYTNKAGLDRVAFIQAYEGKVKRARERAMMPASLAHGIDAASASCSNGDRKMLEGMKRQYDDKKDYYERVWHGNSRMQLDEPDEPDTAALLEASQQKALEDRLERRSEEDDL